MTELRVIPVEGIPEVRELIDRAYEEVQRADRMRGALELGKLEIEDVPDPDTLREQLAATYDTPDLH